MSRLSFALAGVVFVILLTLTARAQTAPASGSAPASASAKPTLWLIGDSTVNNNANGGLGWGSPNAIGKLFDPDKITVRNNARGGRSARSFHSEGLWDAVKNNLQPGDYVLMQFGHNDGPGSIQQITSSTNGRPELAGIGDETTTGPNSSPQRTVETVHTYGWYMDVYVKDTLDKKATPVMLNPVPHNIWANGVMRRAYANSFDQWASDIALKHHIFYVNLDEISASRMDKDGQQQATAKYFTPPGDGTHTNPAGAQLNAESVVMGIRALKDLKLNDFLSDTGKALEPADAKFVRAPQAATAPAAATGK
jgi:rhamnogalacturonan acetylesterase